MAQSISQEAIGATGLPGATAASRHAGATASGAPVSGTFAVGDYIIDQTGKIYVCTVAGTPGTWVQTGGGTYAPGTTVKSYQTSNVTIAASGSGPTNINSISLTAGTWLIMATGSIYGSSSARTTQDIYFTLTSTGASSTALFATTVEIPTVTTTNMRSLGYTLIGSYVVASTTTIYLTSTGDTLYATTQYATGNNAEQMNFGITAVRTA